MKENNNVIFDESLDVYRISLPYLQKNYLNDYCNLELRVVGTNCPVLIECWPDMVPFQDDAVEVRIKVIEDIPENSRLCQKFEDEGYTSIVGNLLCVEKSLADSSAILYRWYGADSPYTQVTFGWKVQDFIAGRRYKMFLKKIS